MSAVFDAPAGRAKPLSDDEALELQIETAYRAAIKADNPQMKRDCFKVMGLLIAQRSPQQIERLERAKGLR